MSDKKILVNYKGANQETISAGPRDLVRLNPGVNTVDADKWDRIIASAENERDSKKITTPKGGILYLMDNDLVSIVPAKGSDNGGGNLNENGLANITKLNVKDGIEVVNACADIATLNVYLTDEKGSQNRATLVKAIESQIDALEVAAKKAAEGKED
jgi:hypothetical protein